MCQARPLDPPMETYSCIRSWCPPTRLVPRIGNPGSASDVYIRIEDLETIEYKITIFLHLQTFVSHLNTCIFDPTLILRMSEWRIYNDYAPSFTKK